IAALFKCSGVRAHAAEGHLQLVGRRAALTARMDRGAVRAHAFSLSGGKMCPRPTIFYRAPFGHAPMVPIWHTSPAAWHPDEMRRTRLATRRCEQRCHHGMGDSRVIWCI